MNDFSVYDDHAYRQRSHLWYLDYFQAYLFRFQKYTTLILLLSLFQKSTSSSMLAKFIQNSDIYHQAYLGITPQQVQILMSWIIFILNSGCGILIRDSKVKEN